VNRSPVSGRIEKIVYRKGLFLNADLDKASEDNERNSFLIATANRRIGDQRFRRPDVAGIAPARRQRPPDPAGGSMR